MEETITKEQLLSKRNTLKTKMDLRRLFINMDRKLISFSLNSIKQHRKEFKQFQKEYLELLDEL